MASEAVAYVAGLVDGEGSITVQRNEHRGTPQYALCLAVEMDVAKSAAALNVCRSAFGGNVTVNRQGRNGGAHAATAAWRLHGAQAACALDHMLPVLRAKRRQAEAAVALFRRESERPTMANGKRRWTPERLEDWRGLYDEMGRLNARGDQPHEGFALLVGDRWMVRTEATLFDPPRWETFSGRWPSSGSMRNGVCSPRPPLVPRTNGSGSGCWPTPTAMDCRRSGGNPDTTGTHGVTLTDAAVRQWATPAAREDQRSPEAHLAMKARMGGGRTEATSLTVQAKMWPTPTASDHEGNGMRSGDRAGEPKLAGAARLWPTPVARNAKGRAGSNRNSPELPDLVQHGRPGETTPTDGESGSPKVDLNPRFVESLMGLPLGWLTPSTSVETDSFQRWLLTHSLPSPNGSASTCGAGEAA